MAKDKESVFIALSFVFVDCTEINTIFCKTILVITVTT